MSPKRILIVDLVKYLICPSVEIVFHRFWQIKPVSSLGLTGSCIDGA